MKEKSMKNPTFAKRAQGLRIGASIFYTIFVILFAINIIVGIGLMLTFVAFLPGLIMSLATSFSWLTFWIIYRALMVLADVSETLHQNPSE